MLYPIAHLLQTDSSVADPDQGRSGWTTKRKKLWIMFGGSGIVFSLQSWSFLLELGSHSYRPKIKYLGLFFLIIFIFRLQVFPIVFQKNPESESRLRSRSSKQPGSRPNQVNLDMKHWLIQDKINQVSTRNRKLKNRPQIQDCPLDQSEKSHKNCN